MPSFATFCDTPIFTGFDDHAARSCVSLDWVINSGLPTRASQLSGPLTLPCDAGVISMLFLDVPVTASLPCDLVLGLDWLHHVQNSAPQLVVHLSSGSLDLQTTGLSSFTSSQHLAPVSRADICVETLASSAFTGGPGAVPTPSPSLMPRTRDVVVVAPGMPRLREIQTSRMRDGIFGQDVQTADKIAVVHLLIVNHQIDVLALRKMTARHQNVSARLSGEKRKSAAALRSEFLVHQFRSSAGWIKSAFAYTR
ncbi:hypothetical protein B0H19DRAFT_1074114 [Mycena capillaripes]|nr:hypothetical protein B0H19DRAFT_1074114 [Mycena capillaripes]